MAPQRQTGGNSYIFLGRQPKRGSHITGATVFQGIAPDWNDLENIVPALIPRQFPFIRNTLDPTAETTASESIVGANAAAQDIITSRGAGGEWEFEVLPEDVIHLLYGWFNPETLPTNTDIISRTGAGVIPAAKITNAAAAGGRQTITIDNTGNSPPIADTWPGKLKLKFPASSELDGAGKVTIFGEQRRSRSNNFNSQVTETFDTTAAKLEADDGVIASKFYRKIDRVVLSGFTKFAQTSEKPTLTFLADTKQAGLTLHPLGALFAGWSSQMVKAGTVFIGFDIVPNSFRLSVSSGSMRLVLTLIASYVQEGRVLVKPLDVAYKLPKYDRPETGKTDLAAYETTASAQTDQKEVLTNYPYKNLNFYPSNGTAVALGEPRQSLAELVEAVEANTATIVPITSIDINGTHNYGDPGGFTGDPVGGEPTTAEGQTREVSVSATIVHETDPSYTDDNKTVFWQDRYFEGQEIPIIVRNYNWSPDGRQNLIETRMPNCKLTEVPGLPIDGQGEANRTLAFGASPTGTGKPDEISMHIYSQGGFTEN